MCYAHNVGPSSLTNSAFLKVQFLNALAPFLSVPRQLFPAILGFPLQQTSEHPSAGDMSTGYLLCITFAIRRVIDLDGLLPHAGENFLFCEGKDWAPIQGALEEHFLRFLPTLQTNTRTESSPPGCDMLMWGKRWTMSKGAVCFLTTPQIRGLKMFI